jgi:hypothetical protein
MIELGWQQWGCHFRQKEEPEEYGRNFRLSTLDFLNLRDQRHPSGVCETDFYLHINLFRYHQHTNSS